MLPLSSEQRETGKENYYEAVGVTRRDFIKNVAAAGVVSGAGLGAMYFGYGKVNDPVRVGIIGVGDEGNVLLGGCTPEYVNIKAIADIRPSSIHRAFWRLGQPGILGRASWLDQALWLFFGSRSPSQRQGLRFIQRWHASAAG